MFSKDQMIGKYQIIERLGAGGFGTVYLAKDRLLNRQVALKVPHQQADETMVLHEPRIMADLKHPNIVELFTVEENEGSFFMVMEYVQGESLDRQIRKERGIQPPVALGIAIGVCSAIAFAHSHQKIHRDLRPANILMTEDGTPKVTDFGTSRILDLQIESYARTRIGSPPYMAPEHFRGRAVFQSDLWSLGITIYEMLTGTVPFYDVDPAKIAQAFTTRDIVAPHLRNPQVPKALSEVVMKCLKVNLGDRYISAQELLKDLKFLKDGLQRENRSLHTLPIMANFQVDNPSVNQKGYQTFCWNCHHPIQPTRNPICPRCKEKN
ncbi:MAG: serine/threonine protein kinase [Holophagaceae bacterium]|nr:serine/threonine protein kinase [Holophagaceae bacterium]